jgi:hypothetical protein
LFARSAVKKKFSNLFFHFVLKNFEGGISLEKEKVQEKVQEKTEYLKEFMDCLKSEFPEFEFELGETMDYIEAEYCDVYNFTSIYIELNDYNVPVRLVITKADLDEEIITPEACHDCIYEDCQFYKCRSEEDVEKEMEEWSKTLYESEKLTVKRVVIDRKCYVNIPHYHYYRAYEISLNQSLLPQTVKAVDELFDLLVELAEKAS